MQNKINVHEFDTQLKYIPQNNFSVDQKRKMFEEFKSTMLDLNVEKNCISGLDLIIFGLDNNSNYDDKNNCDASDILSDILSKNYTELIFLISEQLGDMYILGRCPQGRTTRLLQIWNMF
jgi:hypothetical protein